MSSKHTQNPWRIVPRSGPGGIKAEIAHGDTGECIAEGIYEMADAHLMAAARVLLAALQRFDVEDAELMEGEEMTITVTHEDQKILRSAIASATGKEPQ